MAVQQNKKSPSKRGMHRAHDFLTNPPLAIEPSTGEVHLRHHISPNGYYRGKKSSKLKTINSSTYCYNPHALYSFFLSQEHQNWTLP